MIRGGVVQKLQEYWADRTARQKLMLAGAFLATFLAVAAFAMLAGRTPMALLYGGLESGQAGQVVAAVERSGVVYEVRGDSIWVDAAQRDRLRMDLAGQGLPAAGGAGYELLDGMSGFGTTSQMFDAAYWRAKEGELARTILALPNVRAARVHLAVPASRGYRREISGSASVTLTTSGGPISRAQAKSLKYLVSSGVPGMTPENVTIIDSLSGVVSTGDEDATAQGQDRQDEMRRNVERILEPRVGVGNVLVEVNLDLVTEQELVTEQRFEPKDKAIVSEEVQETSDQSSNGGAQPVTAASNLPENAGQPGDQSKSARSETRSRTNYQVSQVTREMRRMPGATRRLTVAVLVNGVPDPKDPNAPAIPRPQTELDAIRELVASAVGFDDSRGDQITVKSMPFQPQSEAGSLATQGGILSGLPLGDLARIGLIGLFALAFAALVLRPMLRARPAGKTPQLDDSRPLPTLPAPGDAPMTDIAMVQPEAYQSLPAPSARPASFDFSLPTITAPSDDPVARLKEMMKARQDESLRILSGWIADKGGAR
ncbi:flagellar basal-body MS-ring/collar protein FliF [Paracoccus pacificus]|uniref:Flagellar M-ring protein n=1 Tax=Paracoccus pacificus TaxID=1463598 RepID=A0ABW4RCT5_9RHOB